MGLCVCQGSSEHVVVAVLIMAAFKHKFGYCQCFKLFSLITKQGAKVAKQAKNKDKSRARDVMPQARG